jgi:hypothetical protein
MNIGMTALQDVLATQMERPDQQQQDAIRAHPVKGGMMLANIGIVDELWLDIVTSHHDEATDKGELWQVSPAQRLARIVRVVDRYAAMISPRRSRVGRSASESVRSIMGDTGDAVRPDRPLAGAHRGSVPARHLCAPGQRRDRVVMRRSSKPNYPHVAIVLNEIGELLPQPRLHRTALGSPQIRSALAASSVRVQLNHHLVLQLGAYAAQQS